MRYVLGVCLVCLTLGTAGGAEKASPAGSGLYVGWAAADITPERPVALVGQLRKRISTSVLDPLTATALAIEKRTKDGKPEQAVMVSCDVLYIKKAVQEELREMVKARIPDFDVEKLLLNATHTHTAPGFVDGAFKGLYDVSGDEGVMKASEYGEFFLGRLAEAVVQAWANRKPAAMSWGLGYAVVGMNRRAHYFDGSTAMYGKTSREDFSNVEGYEDHGVEMLFFWGDEKELTGVVINLACTSQETEGLSEISADFWHDVRVEIRKRFSDGVFVLAQCAAAGDISPHLIYRKQAEDIMRQRRGLDRRQEIARRIVDAVEDVLPLAKKEIETDIIFRHIVAKADLPTAQSTVLPFYETDSVTPIEFHVIRLGDIAIATNPFELYLDYGVRIKSRSPATMTMLVQLSCQHSGYLPTEKAVQGGGYSADKYTVGPEGGQTLVNETLKHINALWQ
ncbi:MAG: hypothetical protein ABIF19_20825 [Planctomycetota bacterium]